MVAVDATQQGSPELGLAAVAHLSRYRGISDGARRISPVMLGSSEEIHLSAVTPAVVRSALALGRFSSYDFGVVSEKQIRKWADEAEAGYDVDELKRRGRGRPGRGAAPMQVVAVRLTDEELEALDAAAEKNHMSRSEAIRAALAQLSA